MMDWLVVWGVSELGGFLFKEVFAPLVKGALEDYTKDFFKSCITDLAAIAKPEPLKKVAGEALKEFLVLLQDELLAWGLSPSEIQVQYSNAIKQFVYDGEVKPILGKAFELNCKSIDAQLLENRWKQLKLPLLPDEFDWHQIAQQYLRKAKALLRESDDLRKILESYNQDAIRVSVEELAGIPTEFNLKKYQEAIRERYGNLQLDSLDTSGCAYNELKLWKMFIPQNVRECREFLPWLTDKTQELKL